MNQPTEAPRMPKNRTLAQFNALVPALISPLFLAIVASRLPMNTGMNSLGVMSAVARAYADGSTVGNVDMAPLLREYGSGHNRIMHSSFKPSSFSVSVSAANRLSLLIMR